METKVLTANVPPPLAEKVDQRAERLGRSPGWIVEQALATRVDQQEEHRRLTLAALADVDAGRVIDHQAVRAWAYSLGTTRPLPPPSLHSLEFGSVAAKDAAPVRRNLPHQ
jgi:predicted transcriptional regulator